MTLGGKSKSTTTLVMTRNIDGCNVPIIRHVTRNARPQRQSVMHCVQEILLRQNDLEKF